MRLVHSNLHDAFQCSVYDVTSRIKMAAGGKIIASLIFQIFALIRFQTIK